MSTESNPTSTIETISFNRKKLKSRPTTLRKRQISSEPEEAQEQVKGSSLNSIPSTSAVIIPPKKQILNHLIQGTNTNKRRKGLEDSNEILSESDEEGGEVNNKSKGLEFNINHSIKSIRERRRSSSPPAETSSETIRLANKNKSLIDGDNGEKEINLNDGLYHGVAAQAHKLPKAFSGPVKGGTGPSNVRTITLVDYQPDVCKDYKETGFCGFGDTCKFLHDRGDYLQGWQLDNSFLSSNAASGSFLAKQAARANGGIAADDDSDSENEDLPFACLICRQPFGKEPIITLCGHYFDSSCAVKRFGKTGKCFACGKGTNGVFNKATKLINQMKEREKIAAAAALEEQEFEEDDNADGGIEIEGLRNDGSATNRGADDSSDDEPKVVKRRPIIEIQ